jgi:hypothetical protein
MAWTPSVGWTKIGTSNAAAAMKNGRRLASSSSRPHTSVPISTPAMPSCVVACSSSAMAASVSCNGTEPSHRKRDGDVAAAVARASFWWRANVAASAGSAHVVSVTGTGESTCTSMAVASIASSRRPGSQHTGATGRNTASPRMIRPSPRSSMRNEGQRPSPVDAA